MTPYLAKFSSVGTGRAMVRRSTLSCAVELLCALALAQAHAATTEYVYYEGRPFFEYELLAAGEDAFEQPEIFGGGPAEHAERALTNQELSGLMLAGSLWAEILGPEADNTVPVKVQIVGKDENFQNAAANYYPNIDASGQPAYLPAPLEQIAHNENAQYPLLVLVGSGLDFIYPDYWHPLPDGSGFDYSATIFHELGHALGIIFNEGYKTNYNDFLYDLRGTRYQHGMELTYFDAATQDPTDFDDNVFLVGLGVQSGVYFKGSHVSEVLAGSDLPGIPMNGMELDENNQWLAELSHFELDRSMMSHQFYRNYTFFMEVELAAMQDLGYTIDRKNFYGRSIYADHQTIVNHQGFYARTADGSAYLPGEVNTATLGTGLHIYGSANDVTQAADLLAGGAGGTGIRVDGADNTVTIRDDVKIRADGAHGTGVLFAYGKDHTLNAGGTVTALGDSGIALRFDFGGNLLGNYYERRGSYIWCIEDADRMSHFNEQNGAWQWAVSDFNGIAISNDGALMDQVNVTGTLAGTQAAIYISDNALVQELNILPGAHIYGDIVSKWDPNSPYITAAAQDPSSGIDLTTDLNFGAATARTLSARSQEFDLTLYGSIDGQESFDLTLLNGKLTVLGSTNTLSLANYGELTLLGHDDEGYTLRTQKMLLTDDSVLRLPNGAKAQIGTAHLAGTLAIPQPVTYYHNGKRITAEVMLESSAISGHFAQAKLELPTSPTLSITHEELQTQSSAGAVTFLTEAEVGRTPDAYAQYADSAATATTGQALVQVADTTHSPYAPLLEALDFSHPSGNEITKALHTLSAESYSAAAQAMLRQLKAEDRQLMFQQWAEPLSAGTNIYGELLYSTYDSDAAAWDSEGFSAVVGADTKLNQSWSVGINLTLSSLNTDIDGQHHASSDAQSILAGVRTLYRPNEAGWYLQGSVRAGLQEGDLKRSLNIGRYHADMDSDWQAFIGTIQTAVGYDLVHATDDYSLRTGPFGGIHYALLRTSNIEESGPAALDVDGNSYDSMPLELGWRLQWARTTESGTTLKLAADASWFYDVLDNQESTAASFRYANAATFDSELERDGRSGAYLNLGAELKFVNGFAVGLTCGALTGSQFDSLNLAADLSYRF
ncbi:MAG: autotransporter outer membrane beta-barrel domain-containing protein [Anaerobiospirillum sp.]|nr:autotransporter outer membrane beta-barrel domain-containing protein [Anaerobiospirillum sp.]